MTFEKDIFFKLIFLKREKLFLKIRKYFLNNQKKFFESFFKMQNISFKNISEKLKTDRLSEN